MTEIITSLFADYCQFYVQDDSLAGIVELSWNDEAIGARVALAPNAFAVSTARNMEVPVRLVILPQEPELTQNLWDHIVEFSISVNAPKLIIAGCTEYLPEAQTLALEPGHYQVRVLFANLGDLSEDGLDGGDHYQVEMWQGPTRPLRVLKQYSG